MCLRGAATEYSRGARSLSLSLFSIDQTHIRLMNKKEKEEGGEHMSGIYTYTKFRDIYGRLKRVNLAGEA